MTTGRFCRPRCWYDYRQTQQARRVGSCRACGKAIDSSKPGAAKRAFCSRKCSNDALVHRWNVPEPPPVDGARWLPLTRGQFALVDADLFEVVASRPWTHVPDRAPSHYRRDGSPRQLHRFVMGVTDPVVKVDHRNGNTSDNRRQNLRVATQAQNVWNARKKRSARTSVFKGVHKGPTPGPRPWQATIRVSGRNRHLGCFATPEKAALAYDAAAREAFGEFACVNFPEPGERSAIQSQ
jgi:hypothetical protein